MRQNTGSSALADFDASSVDTGSAHQNDFDRNEGWITVLFTGVFVICGVVSGYATFTGIRLFLDETGDVSLLTKGTSVILTLAVSAILTVGWSVICRWGPEARNGWLKTAMVGLGAALFAITLSVSSLSNLMALVGPAAKVADWKAQHAQAQLVVNAYGNRALSVAGIQTGWKAEMERSCRLANGEMKGGLVSATGAGVGPVASALIGVCEQTKSFVASAETAIADTHQAVAEARDALRAMRHAIRNRSVSVTDREDAFLDAGERLNGAVQGILTADLSRVLRAGAHQVSESIAELTPGSSFTAKQVEAVSSVKQGLGGLVASTTAITEEMSAEAAPDYAPVTSLGFLEAIFAYGARYIPVFAAAIGIDCFQIWALGFLLVSKAGRARRTR